MNKIETNTLPYNSSTHELSQMYKPIYSEDEELDCGIIEYNNKKYLMNKSDKYNIINFDKKFTFYDAEDIYPSYRMNYRKINYLEFIYGLNPNKVSYSFLNKNCFDLRRGNVITKPLKKQNGVSDKDTKSVNDEDLKGNEQKVSIDDLLKPYNVIEQFSIGERVLMGREANKIKNPIWKILNEKGQERLIMYCETNTICILCPDAYQKIVDYELANNEGKKIIFFKMQNGYICSNIRLYIHQIITGCHGNGKGTKNVSVDHIDRNPLNNTIENLRIASRNEQEDNSKGIAEGTKRERKHSAKPLPEGLKQDMMRKYVVYYHEWLNPERSKSREYFKIEKHPKLEKMWVGTKSNKVSLLDKLAAVNKYADELLLL
jgi:hypothetical protein